jgi:hypothetical protein
MPGPGPPYNNLQEKEVTFKMFITEAEMKRRLASPKNLVNSLGEKKDYLQDNQLNQAIHIPLVKHTSTAPDEIKNLAANLIAAGEKKKVVAKELNLSPKQIASAQEKFRVSSEKTIDRLRELAIEKTIIALGLMTQDKFENASLKDLAATAASLSRTIERTSPKEANNTVQFIIHAPQAKTLGQYKVLDV